VYDGGKGHTQVLAESIFNGIRSKHVRVHMLDVNQVDVPQMEETDTIVFGCPTYLTGTSAAFKDYMERSSFLCKNQSWKYKMAAGFTCGTGSTGDKLFTIQQIASFAAQHSMVWIPQGNISVNEGAVSEIQHLLNESKSSLGCISNGESNLPNDQEPSLAEKETAYFFGQRIANITRRWVR
jgi:multimeric flavodoxin WrbA